MRLLADENCPLDIVEALRQRGHDVVWIRSDAPGSKDPAILLRAQQEQRTILTFDKDFGELAFRSRQQARAGVILCRLHGLPPARLTKVVVAAIEQRASWEGLFGVIHEQRLRITPLPG